MTHAPSPNAPLARGVTMVIPVRNEEAAIQQTLDDVFSALRASGWDHEVIVVDDGSTDRSAAIVEKDGRARLVRHPRNRGVGAARNTGLALARFDRVAMIDADGTYPPSALPELLVASEKAPQVVGARVKRGAAIPLLRRPAKWFIRRLAEYLSGERIPDLNSGLRIFHTEPARAIRHLLPPTHSWVSTITLAFLASGLEVAYVPIEYHPRIGRSTFHPVRDTYNYLTLVIRSIVYFNPLKVFLPAAFVMGVVGTVKLFYDWWVFDDIHDSEVIVLVSCVTVALFGFLADLVSAQNRIGGPGSPLGR
jgi:glycosyltransferase involved in cell wall biosynthesis